MHNERLITGVAAALGGSAALLAVVAVVYNPAILAISAALGVGAYFMWYQASGRLAARVYRSVEQQAADGRSARTDGATRTGRGATGGFGAGPREEWTPPGDRGGSTSGRRRAGGQRQRQRQRQRAPSTTSGPSESEAYRILGLDPSADQEAVKEAYRAKVKEVHPDTDGGDEEQFKQVNRAYERLTGGSR